MQLKQYHTYAGTNKDIVIWPVSFSAPEELWEPVVAYKFLKVVRRHLPREKVVILVGGDKAASAAEARAYSSMGSWIFQREIND